MFSRPTWRSLRSISSTYSIQSASNVWLRSLATTTTTTNNSSGKNLQGGRKKSIKATSSTISTQPSPHDVAPESEASSSESLVAPPEDPSHDFLPPGETILDLDGIPIPSNISQNVTAGDSSKSHIPTITYGSVNAFGGQSTGPSVFSSQGAFESFPEEKSKNTKSSVLNKYPWLDDIRPPRELKKHLDQYVVGQDEAKMHLCVAVWNHFTRVKANLKYNESEDNESTGEEKVFLDKSNVLLLGPSGSGKTLLVKTIAKILDLPYSHNDATTFTQVGYVGEDSDMCILRLYKNAYESVTRTETGIVFIDEVDKLARKQVQGGTTRDVCGEGVQTSFLKMLEGSVITVNDKSSKNRVNIDTSNILFILSGAFVGLENIIHERTNKTSMGFGANIRDAKKANGDAEMLKNTPAPLNPLTLTEPVDLVNYGLIPEFVGRLPVVVSLHKLSITDLIHVMTQPKNSIIKQAKALFAEFDVKLDITDDAILEIAKLAHSRQTGARGLRSILEKLLAEPTFLAPDGNIACIRIDAEVVRGIKRPILEERESVEVLLEAEIIRTA